MPIEYSECEKSPWSPDAVTPRSTFKSERKDPLRMVPRAPGEVLMESKVARTYFRRADFASGVSVKGVLDADACELDKDENKLTAEHVGGSLKLC